MRITCPHCGKQFSAWEDLAGQTVKCPKCQQTTVIAGPNEALGAPPVPPGQRAPAKPAPAKPAPANPARANPPPASRSQPPKSPVSPIRPAAAIPGNRPAGGPAVPPSAKPPMAPPQPASAPAARVVSPTDLDDDDSLPNGCPNCNATMTPNEDLCDACGFHLVLKKVIDIRDMPKRNQATGMERLLQDHLQDPESTSNTLMWAKIAGCLVGLVILGMCLGRWWWVGVLIAAGVGGLYWMKQRQRFAEGNAESSVNEDPISQVVWPLLLGAQRILGWRKLEWPFPRARSLILRDPAFHDRELGGLDGLAEFEVMDLEGTGITDEGLNHFRPLKQLRFLVLRRTQVTAAAARKLQADMQKTLIWY